MFQQLPQLFSSRRFQSSAWDKDDESGVGGAPPPPPVSSAAEIPEVHCTDGRGQKFKVTPLGDFKELDNDSKIPDWLQQGIHTLGYKTPTLIQSYTIPVLEKGADAIGLAPTGSGKTVAFGIPSLSTIKRASHNPQILVLCPVRELCQQTTKVMKGLCQHNRNIHICEAYGGSPRDPQLAAIRRGCDVLVATPGRLVDFLDSGAFDFSELKFFIFDEADRLLDMGFSNAIDKIFSFVDPQKQRQTMMWSATWPP